MRNGKQMWSPGIMQEAEAYAKHYGLFMRSHQNYVNILKSLLTAAASKLKQVCVAKTFGLLQTATCADALTLLMALQRLFLYLGSLVRPLFRPAGLRNTIL